MKKFLVVGAIALAGLGLTGCSGEVKTGTDGSSTTVENDWGSGSVSVIELPTETGSVTCAVMVGYSKGGLSCDWANAE